MPSSPQSTKHSSASRTAWRRTHCRFYATSMVGRHCFIRRMTLWGNTSLSPLRHHQPRTEKSRRNSTPTNQVSPLVRTAIARAFLNYSLYRTRLRNWRLRRRGWRVWIGGLSFWGFVGGIAARGTWVWGSGVGWRNRWGCSGKRYEGWGKGLIWS